MSLRTRRLSYDIGSNRHIQSAASLIVNLSTAQKFLWKNYAAAPYLLIRSPFAYVMGEEMNWIFWAFIVAAVIHVVKEYKYPGGFSDAMKRFNNLDNLDKIHRQAKRNMVYCPKPYSHQSLVLFVPNRTYSYKGMCSMSAEETLVQRAYTSILEHFVQTGRAPHYTELAHTLGVGPDEARDLQRQAAKAGVGCWFVQDTDYIESWAPFYNAPTQYLVTVEGEQKWYGQLCRDRLGSDILSRRSEYLSEPLQTLQELGKEGSFWL